MTAVRTWDGSERRTDVRLAGQGTLEVVILTGSGHPEAVLPSARTLNVSAGGVAITSDLPASPGSRLAVKPEGDALPFQVEVLACEEWVDGRHVMRCRLHHGSIPAKLIYGY